MKKNAKFDPHDPPHPQSLHPKFHTYTPSESLKNCLLMQKRFLKILSFLDKNGCNLLINGSIPTKIKPVGVNTQVGQEKGKKLTILPKFQKNFGLEWPKLTKIDGKYHFFHF